MRWIRLLLICIAVTVLVIGAGLAFLMNLDLNDYKREVERFVVGETGRVFAIDGRLDLELGADIGLTMTDVRLGNPDWAANADMVRIGRARIVLDLRSLWSGPVIVELAELDDAVLHLEQRESGVNNWSFGDGADRSPISLILRQVHVSNFAITVAAPAFDQPLDIQIKRLDQVQAADGLFDATLRGTLNDRAIDLAGRYGPLQNLLAATDLSVDIGGQFDTLSITAAGVIDDLVHPRRPRVDIEITGPDVDHVTQMLGLPDFGHGNLDLKVFLHPGSDDVAISVNGNIGEHRIDATGAVSDLVTFDQGSMRIAAHGPDLSKVTRLFGLSNVPAGPYQIVGSVDRDGARLNFEEVNVAFGEAKLRLHGEMLRFPDFNDSTLDLDVSGEQMNHFTRMFGLPGVIKGPFHAAGKFEVAADGAQTFRLDAVTQIAALAVSGEISEGPGFAGSQVHVSGDGASIAAIATALDRTMSVDESFSFEGVVEFGENALLLADGVTFTVGDNQLLATGAVGFDPIGRDTDLHIRVAGADLAQVGLMAGITGGVPSVRYEVSSRVQTSSDGYQVSGLQARVGAATLSVDGLVSHRKRFAGTRLKLDASGPHLSDFIANTETFSVPGGPFNLSGEFEWHVDAMRLIDVALELGGATATVNADVGLPLAAANGAFSVIASGDSVHTVVPDTGPWEPPDVPFEIRAQGTLEDGLLQVELATIELGAARVIADGVFDMPPDLSRTSLTIEAQAESLAAIGTFDRRSLPDTDFRLEAKFAGTPQSFSLEELTVLSGDSDLTGSVVVHLDQKIPAVNLQLHSKFLDLTPWLGKKDEAANVVDGDENASETKADDGRLIPEWSVPVEQLQRFNAVIDIDINQYRQNQRQFENVIVDARLLDGQLDVERATGETAYGSASATLRIVSTNAAPMVRATFDGKNIFLGDFTNRTREDIDAEPKYDVSVNLEGVGLTLRDIAANLNGRVKVSANEGRVPNSALRFVYGDFVGELFTAMNPFVKMDPYTNISCVMIVAQIDNGLLDARPGATVQTDKMNIISEGTIDLRTEKVNFNFKTASRRKISISAGEFINPYVKVAGTLANPHLTLDPTGTLVSGGAAIATAGLSLLATAVWDRVFSAADPCARVVERAEKKRQKENR